MMSVFKERANTRTQGLKDLLSQMEKERDGLLDEIANKRGQVEYAEKVIKRLYEKILDINKEEQQKELEEIRVQAEKQKEEFQSARVGIKTPKAKRGG